MTNEELAVQAQQGDEQAVLDLWRAVLRLCVKLAKKYIPMLKNIGYDLQDLEQECFLAYRVALDAYDPNKSLMFNTYLRYSVQNICRDALGIHNGEKIPQTPVSLDEPISDESGSATRAELVPDSRAVEALQAVEEFDYTVSLHNALKASERVLEPNQRYILHAVYWRGKTLKEIGVELGIDTATATALKAKAIRRLRNDRILSRQYREDVITTRAYRGTGFHAWKYGGSVEERTIEYLELHDL